MKFIIEKKRVIGINALSFHNHKFLWVHPQISLRTKYAVTFVSMLFALLKNVFAALYLNEIRINVSENSLIGIRT